ncbi:hypothetical protein H4R33_000543 [Dimargaris cristalligena]|uniref:COPI associated protein-domain-containing protein n=1 Tax=Dimargaris cristalligena TaxID=215637 RepID=A0A4Q0A155_9FUNG|nr:hypothetical protein H4R33_000543 [Dimargaris cristalligena]RKP39757.1 COPI associated protein-domain-containing protein [Dimargaris cristalligena]|eukprot:RKP39757.1 COPI associated protein-domain-containing protein [Dimargaris cristalligena]
MPNHGYVGNDTSLSWLFRILNVIVAVLIAVGGVIFIITGRFQPIVVGILLLIFTVLILALEISRPWALQSKCEFLFMFIGRGLLYIFLGILNLAPELYHLISGGVVGLIGLLFCIMHFTSFELYARDPHAPAPVHPTVRYPAIDSRYDLPAAYV